MVSDTHKHVNLTTVLLDSCVATFLLLLVVSCGIVFRSFLIRRRLRAHIRDARAAGLEVDEYGDIVVERLRQESLGDKPIMWEVWVDENGDGMNDDGQMYRVSREVPSSEFIAGLWDQEKAHDGCWKGILPVAVKALPPLSPFYLFSTPDPPMIHPQHSASWGHSSPLDPVSHKLEVSVLIAMPNPNRRSAHCLANCTKVIVKGKEKDDADVDDEGDIPDLSFGVTKVGIRS